jgi:hypothetical protein
MTLLIMTLLIMTLLIMTILITLNTGYIPNNDFVHKLFFLYMTLVIRVNKKHI